LLTLRVVIFAAVFAQTLLPANLAVSTYLKDGFTPSAIATDAQGNVYLAGYASIDPVSQTSSAVVAKLDPKVSGYVYLTYLDSAGNDTTSAMTVDAAGDVYLAGGTANPNFPVVGGQLGSAPSANTDNRSFVTKLDPRGVVVFSVLIGGDTASTARGIALTPEGQILVSGIATGSGFPTTAGAYAAADSKGQWYLVKLDGGASKVIFSATGIGGSSLAFDPSGDIYMAGNGGANYPTTPGAYQTTFVPGYVCGFPCQFGFPGSLQHVTKVDAAATKLLYSTGLNDPSGGAGSTSNTGLAVDAAGNAYVTGTVEEGSYPFTVAAPTNHNGYITYLSKLDPEGAKLLFSIPAGGAGVQIDSSGAVYAGGFVSSYDFFGFGNSPAVASPPAVLAWVPKLCWPDAIRAYTGAYVLKLDGETGDAIDAQWIGGSGPFPTAIALTASGRVWITGSALTNDVPISPGAFAPDNIQPGFLGGVYLGAVDFAGGANAGPAIACVLDSGNMEHVGPVAPYQLISIYGQNLGPQAGLAAPSGGLITLGGVSITFDGIPAELLYVSDSQINVVVPGEATSPSSMTMILSASDTNVERQFPVVRSNPNLFADLSSNVLNCGGIATTGFQPLALNADGSSNSCAHYAAFGSTVSFFVHGIGPSFAGQLLPSALYGFSAKVGSCPAVVTGAALINGYVYKVDVQMPDKTLGCSGAYSSGPFSVSLNYNGAAIGPRVVSGYPNYFTYLPGTPLSMIIWLQ
jgi:uncharacterized protein (TIGR03437 family)